ncbi:MAG: TrkH family potassium uptake protein [Massiliimalia sp.]|jgi:trk system potassium uptake protein TrkH
MQIKVKNTHNKFSLQSFFKNPARVIVVSFAVIILMGTFLLMLPISSREQIPTSFQNAFFTATSATCVTGLVVVDTYQYFSLFGQVVILLLIQMGGLGLVTITTFFNLAIRKRLRLKTMQIAQESINSDSMNDISSLIRMIIALTFSIEFCGALALSTVFIPKYGLDGIFISVFLAISSYCNAGFDILGREGAYVSLTHYADNPVVLITIMCLIIFGGLGFVVWHDLYEYRFTKRIMLHTKIVLVATAVLIVFGGLMIMMLEWSNPRTLGPMSVPEKLLNSMFLSVSCRTAGYNSFDLNGMNGITKLVCIAWMFIGAAPGSTGGGIKVTTFVVLFMTVVCTLSGKDDTIIWDRRVDKEAVYKALSVVVVAMIAVLGATCFIGLTIHSGGAMVSDINALFESTSAFATVGLSVGVTGVANPASRMILAATMFLGRVGPVSLALSMSWNSVNIRRQKHQIKPEGKILIG